MSTKNFLGKNTALPLAALMLFCMGAWAQSNGTTLAASKTIDICVVDESTWKFSGEVSVWNEGAIDTAGFQINDCIQNKVGKKWNDASCQVVGAGAVIPAGTTLETATTFPYEFFLAPLSGDIRNAAKVTIMNHSGSLGTAFGPQPKATWAGGTPPPCVTGGCTYTQGYWGNKPGVVWPPNFDRGDPFFDSGKTWQGILDVPVGGNGYYILGKQYIAAVLNQANDAPVPAGVQDFLNLATTWFTGDGATTAELACPLNSSCGLQKTWAGVLDDYNNGVYAGGPGHCGDE